MKGLEHAHDHGPPPSIEAPLSPISVEGADPIAKVRCGFFFAAL